MNLTDAQTELAGRGFDYLDTGRMTIMLNNAKNALEDAWEFPWLYAIQTGPAPLVIPDLKYVLTVQTSEGELLGIDIRQLLQGSTDLAESGPPEYWYLGAVVGDATTMATWPSSDVDVTVAYIKSSPELVQGTDTPLIPPRYHPLWLDLAVVEAYHDSDNFTGAQALRADVNARIGGLIERYETRNRQHAEFIGQRGFSEDD